VEFPSADRGLWEDKRNPIKVEGGEYQIYSRPYTAAAGTTTPGDAVRVRVRASDKRGETVTATLSIGEIKKTFKVTAK
jgi:hypothetical protein